MKSIRARAKQIYKRSRKRRGRGPLARERRQLAIHLIEQQLRGRARPAGGTHAE